MGATLTIRLHCWVCDQRFEAEQPRSYALSGRGSDLCPRPVGLNPLPLLVHICPNCGFTGDGRGFDPEQADDQVQEWVLAGGLTALDRDSDRSDVKYERAALCHARRRRPSPLQVAEFYLAASWSAQLEEAPERAPSYQEEAAGHLERALLIGEVADEERAIMSYLAGELRRRLGEFEAALQLFDEAAVEFTQHGGPRWLLQALGQQAGLAKHRSSAEAELAVGKRSDGNTTRH